MIVVRIEVWPFGNRSRRREIGQIVIANDATGDCEIGNYNAALAHAGPHADKPGCWKAGRVERHPRILSPYHLVLRAIESCLAGRKSKIGDRLVGYTETADMARVSLADAEMPFEWRTDDERPAGRADDP